MWRLCSVLLLSLVSLCVASGSSPETPTYTVLSQKNGYEIREYAASTQQYWTETIVHGDGWQSSSSIGFYRLFGYISGQNSAQLKINMTAPVTMSHNSSNYTMRFFVPAELTTPPQPTSPAVTLVSEWQDKVAVIEFGGWATQSNSDDMTTKLLSLLQQDNISIDSTSPVRVAQYNSPYDIKNRVNEIWVPVRV